MIRKKTVILVCVLMTGVFSKASAEVVFENPAGTRTALVELFSSEGCSSCPPADRWFSGLLNDSRLWRDFVPAVFHVTYWDHLGWKDRLAKPEYTKRQYAYAASWGSRSVYTPGVVLNGREWRGWQSGVKPSAEGESPGRLRAVSREGVRFEVTFEPHSGNAEKFEVFGVLLGFNVENDIMRGENSGRVLKHDFVVLDLQKSDFAKDGQAYRAVFEFSENGSSEKRKGAAFWVQKTGSIEPLQAAGGFI